MALLTLIKKAPSINNFNRINPYEIIYISIFVQIHHDLVNKYPLILIGQNFFRLIVFQINDVLGDKQVEH